jgi:hypothetical protein
MAKPFSEDLMGNTVTRRTRPAPVVAPVGGGATGGHCRARVRSSCTRPGLPPSPSILRAPPHD